MARGYWPAVLALLGTTTAWGAAPVVLEAADYGVVGDGVADDGPAVQRLVAAAAAARGPVEMRFAAGLTVRVETAQGRYLFALDRLRDVTLAGGGCTFVLGPQVRFLSLTNCERVRVERLQVDFGPLPFVDGTVVAAGARERTLEVRVPAGEVGRVVGGPTGEDGEQAFFAMLWHEGPYSTLSEHCWVERMEAAGEGLVRVHAAESFGGYGAVEPGRTRISLPVPGIAHRYGPGPCLRIADCDTVTVEDVELWSAPWFGYEVSRKRGQVTFRRAHIRPKPGSGRLVSTWRDGYHVKGNSATLLWEDCELAGMNDDAFNISTHSSSVLQRLTATEVEVGQRFPLLPIPWYEGGRLRAADDATGRLLGEANIVEAVRGPEPPPIAGMPAAPMWRLRLDRALEGLAPGSRVWDPDQCNPDTTLRRCRIRMSCRLQSPVQVEDCDVAALLWFYAEGVEGGFPAGVRVVNSVLRRGRGNPTLALAVGGGPEGAARGRPESWACPRAVHDVTLEGNEVWGALVAEGVERLRVRGNRFGEAGAAVRLEGCTGPDGEALTPGSP